MEGRDERGRFIKGHKSNGGRPDKADRDSLRAIIDAHVSPEAEGEAWRRVQDALLHGGRGWLDLFKLYLEYRYGKPVAAVDVSGEVAVAQKGYVAFSPDEWEGTEEK